MSTARRIQLGILLTVFAVMAVCGVGILWLVRAELVGQIDDQLETGAETIDGIADPVAAAEIVDTVSAQPDRESALLVFDADGDLTTSASSGTGGGDPLPDIGKVGVGGLRANAGSPFQLPAVD
ncbi:MAG: hypothetical protein OSA99_04675, partial [Acidimicrobiales bacterium]|nr:hypothetical protein [Acidimicrobiales bacterium]